MHLQVVMQELVQLALALKLLVQVQLELPQLEPPQLEPLVRQAWKQQEPQVLPVLLQQVLQRHLLIQ
jgi:hypothetical protein